MRRLILLCAVGVLFGFTVGASADIVFDGYENDWTGGGGQLLFLDHGGVRDVWNPSQPGDTGGRFYDIRVNGFWLGTADNNGFENVGMGHTSRDPMYYFLTSFFDVYPTGPDKHSNDKGRILVDVDGPPFGPSNPGAGIGGVDGVDYYFEWNLDDPAGTQNNNLYVRKWNGSAWQLIDLDPGPGTTWATGSVIWRNNGTSNWSAEWALDPRIIWGAGQIKDIWWNAYVDNDWTYSDDNCPDSPQYDPGPVPEPGTYALFGLGLLGLMAIRRRRSKDAE
jgi:hypothetical protein